MSGRNPHIPRQSTTPFSSKQSATPFSPFSPLQTSAQRWMNGSDDDDAFIGRRDGGQLQEDSGAVSSVISIKKCKNSMRGIRGLTGEVGVISLRIYQAASMYFSARPNKNMAMVMLNNKIRMRVMGFESLVSFRIDFDKVASYVSLSSLEWWGMDSVVDYVEFPDLIVVDGIPRSKLGVCKVPMWINEKYCAITEFTVVMEEIAPSLGTFYLEDYHASVSYGMLLGTVMNLSVPDREGIF